MNKENNIPNFPKKENNFKVPNDYFEDLPLRVTEKIHSKKQVSFNLNKLLFRYLIPSASLIILLIFILNWNNTTKTEISDEQLSEFLIEDADEYFEDELIYESYVENISIENNEEETEENYIDYLVENDIEINTIIEEL